MELKQMMLIALIRFMTRINRTFMELKLLSNIVTNGLTTVLIEPLWN